MLKKYDFLWAGVEDLISVLDLKLTKAKDGRFDASERMAERRSRMKRL